uniref:Uncharacterized protein n=1 Tax=Parascaris equorum TaxID=6256 RepID=A0A914S6T9_PAREQ
MKMGISLCLERDQSSLPKGDLFHTRFYVIMSRSVMSPTLESSSLHTAHFRDDRVSWVVTEPYTNDGATIWGSSAVMFRQSQMLIGSLFGRLLHCDIDNPQLV